MPVVIGERVDKVGMRLQYCEQGVRDGLCRLVGSLGNDAVACPALRKREQDGTAADLAADRGLVTIQGVGNPALVVPPFQKCLDLVSFFLGELRVVSHRGLSCLSV